MERLFDRELVRLRRRRAGARGGEHFLIGRLCEDVAERIGSVNRTFERMLEISAVPGRLAAPLTQGGKVREAVIGLVGHKGDSAFPSVTIDEEALPFAPQSFDLVASVLTLQSVNDLPGFLVQVARQLVPDGLFVAALFGAGTLGELREAFAVAESEMLGGIAPHVAPFTEVREAGALLQRTGFALPVADSDRIVARYDDPISLMHDLRDMGEANALAERSVRPLRRDVLARTTEIYQERFADPDGRVRASFEIVTMTGWRAAESQPKPLRPGSAQVRLADALGTRERPAGERTGPAVKC